MISHQFKYIYIILREFPRVFEGPLEVPKALYKGSIKGTKRRVPDQKMGPQPP